MRSTEQLLKEASIWLPTLARLLDDEGYDLKSIVLNLKVKRKDGTVLLNKERPLAAFLDEMAEWAKANDFEFEEVADAVDDDVQPHLDNARRAPHAS